MKISDKLKQLGIELPIPPTPVANYVAYKIVDNLIYISGQGPIINGEKMSVGKVGSDVTIEQGYQSARYCGLNIIAQLNKAVGDLDIIEEVVSLKGYVASDNNFLAQPKVVNGASDLMVEVFGEAGKHSRCAIGVNVLPDDITTEVELVARIRREAK